MDKRDIVITETEQAALEIMESPREISARQLQNLEEEECLQTCSDIAETAIGMMQEKELLHIDADKELAQFLHRHNASRRRRRLLWLTASGVAAAVLVMLLLRSSWPAPKPQGVQVFQADHTHCQVMLQTEEEEEPCPIEEAVKSLPHTVTQPADKVISYAEAPLTEVVEEKGKKSTIHRLTIPRGKTYKIVLADGTEIELNADSRLSYPTAFKGRERVVTLEGEAYFKVAKDEQRPFIVKSGNLHVQVVGTEFNLRNYSPTDVSVTLVSGKVIVCNTQINLCAEMHPGQCARFAADGTPLLEDVDISSFLYWKQGLFYFDNVSITDMMQEIGRWYNVDIEIRNELLRNLHIHFFADRQQSLGQTIELLNCMDCFHAYMEEGRLIVN